MRIRLSKMKKPGNNGAALVYAVVCLTVVMAICFLLLIVAYQLLATTNNKKKYMQTAEAAKSFADVLENKITVVVPSSGNGASDVWRYIRGNLDESKWPSYYTENDVDGMRTALSVSEQSTHTEDRAFRYFDLTGVDKACQIKVCIYWVRTGSSANGAILHVKTMATYGEQMYTVESIYKLSIKGSGSNQTWKWTLKSRMY